MTRYRKFIVAMFGLIAAILVAILPQIPAGTVKTDLMLADTAIVAALVYVAPNEPPAPKG